jgi:predicted AlkP superfamily phosphohydrolase/phosphomutase
MVSGKKRTVIIGIDGVPFGLLKELSEKGVMPSFGALRKEGVFKPMRSSIPEISSVSWSSIITGKNPGEHGIYGFTGLIEGTYTIYFPSFRKLGAPAFWHEGGSRTYVILNVPSTYPARELNGVHISGFVSPELEKAVYPPSYLEKLRELGYRVDVDSEKAHKSISLFLDDLFKTHEIRLKTYRYLWEELDWDVFMVVFTGSDRLEHFLWRAYEDENNEYHPKFLHYFREVDRAIGEIAGNIADHDQLIMLSDHGMEGIKMNLNVNSCLAHKNLLLLGDKPGEGYKNIKEGSQAFALDPGRIYLNREGRYPQGSVKPGEEAGILQSLISIFHDLEYNGEKVIKRVCRKDEIYHGRQLEYAPDLVLMSNTGFNLKASMDVSSKDIFQPGGIFSGKHTYEDAFLYVKRNVDLVPAEPCVEDVRKIIEGGY